MKRIKYREIIPVTNVVTFKKELWVRDYSFRLEKWMMGEKAGPVRIDAEITRQCNLNCIFCSRRTSSIDLNEESKRVEMPKERWVELARESGELGVKLWNISGIGEPMMRADVTLATMKMIKAYDMFGELTTNGTLWKDKHIKEVVEMGWDSVCVSIDGPDAKTHDSLRRVKGTFKKAANTVKRFSYWKRKLGADLPSVTINMVLNNRNFMKLPEMVKMAHELGADAIFVEPMVLFSPLAEPLRLREEDISQLPTYIEEARELGEKYGILPTISSVGVEREFDETLTSNVSKARNVLTEDVKNNTDPLLSIPCYAPWLFLMVRVDGSVTPCGELDLVKENIRNKSLKEVWFGEEFQKVRELFTLRQLPPSCDKCRPNTINEMRQIKKAILRYRDVDFLRNEILDLIKENKALRDEVLLLRMKLNASHIKKLKEYEKELLRYKSSLSYKISKKIGNYSIGKLIKKVFGVYV